MAVAILCVGCSDQSEQSRKTEKTILVADSVFLNGGVYTVNSENPWAEALAVVDGEIVYVGDNHGARRWIGPDSATSTACKLGLMRPVGEVNMGQKCAYAAPILQICEFPVS